EEISRVVLGGGFGYFLNPADAVRIGLLPASLEAKAVSGGNTALAGAKRLGASLLTKGGMLAEVLQYSSPGRVEVINLAEQKAFSEKYLAAMAFKPVP
ncbi:MAG: ATP-binding protein, partial [Acetatifactor sp.]|nr:ATP-binding protein [Acetatifactor sp.]